MLKREGEMSTLPAQTQSVQKVNPRTPATLRHCNSLHLTSLINWKKAINSFEPLGSTSLHAASPFSVQSQVRGRTRPVRVIEPQQKKDLVSFPARQGWLKKKYKSVVRQNSSYICNSALNHNSRRCHLQNSKKI